jgi:MOSC domain-containing protein YiiM
MGLSGVGGASSSDDTRTPALDPSRFRPNVVVSGVPAWSEFDWVGKRVYIGSSVILEVIGRAVRCEATNVDPRNGTGVEDHDVPAALARHFPMHGPYLGVYAIVVGGGTIGIGDGVRMTMMIFDREEASEDVAVLLFGIGRGRVVLATAAALVAVAAMVARSRGRSG